MFHVTEEAVAHVAYELARAGAPTDAVVRLIAQNNGLALKPGAVEEGDMTFDHDGRPIIAVSSALAEDLKGVVLQAEETDKGTRLQLRERG